MSDMDIYLKRLNPILDLETGTMIDEIDRMQFEIDMLRIDKEKLHKYGCTLASIYSLVKPLSESNGVCGAIAECIETYTPKVVENAERVKP